MFGEPNVTFKPEEGGVEVPYLDDYLLLALPHLIPKPPGKVLSGEAIFKGRDLLTMSKRDLRDVPLLPFEPGDSIRAGPFVLEKLEVGSVIVRRNPHYVLGVPPLEQEFLKLVLSRAGQEVVSKDGYVPLSARLVEVESLLDRSRRLLWRNGAPVSLTPKAFDILSLLVERNGERESYSGDIVVAGIPGDDDSWDIQEHCQAMLADAGYGQYEVSAYARPGRQCAHNLNYWTYGDYLGIGAGAHGKVTLGHDASILRRWKHKHPSRYLDDAGTTAAIGGEERVEPARRPFEFMLNALRLVDGFTLSMFEARTGLDRRVVARPLQDAIAAGWLALDGETLRPTELGRRFTNDVVALFLD